MQQHLGLVETVFLLLGILSHLITYMKDNIESGHFQQRKVNICKQWNFIR